jgi:hypothetical protein
MAVCVLYSVTLSSSLLLLLLPPSPFVNVGVSCRSEKRKPTSAAHAEAEKEVCRVRVSLYYVCRMHVDGWCRSDIGMDDKRSLSVMNVAIDGKLTRTRTGNLTKE